MTKKKATPQAARSFLFQKHTNGFGIPPAKFAAAANETGGSFDDLIKGIARMYMGGSDSEYFRQQDISAASQGATA
jgi:hypothetical protein